VVTNEQYDKLVSLLHERTSVERRDGVQFLLKRIPDSEAEGELDRRVLEITKQQAAAMAAMTMPDFSKMDLFETGRMMRAQMGWKNNDVTRTGIATSSRTIDGTDGPIPIRIYTPAQGTAMPAVLFFHGGGFVGGTLDVVENPCKALAEYAGAVVVSVDYRLAPENPFPAGLTDCFDAVKWVYAHADELNVNRTQIAVCGDSAGGNLATICAMKDAEQGLGMIGYQALIYPTTNMAAAETDDFAWSLDAYTINNHRELISAGLLGMGQSVNILDLLYLQGRVAATDPYASPLLADEEALRSMPETMIVTAEYDYLRLECEAYARKLARAGVPTTLVQYNGMDHAFIDKIGQYPQAEDCMRQIAQGLRQRFSR